MASGSQPPNAYAGAGQVLPGGRPGGYNRTYWKAVEKDLGEQHRKLRFPNRTSKPKLKVVPPGIIGPYAVKGTKVSTQKTFAGKRGNVQA